MKRLALLMIVIVLSLGVIGCNGGSDSLEGQHCFTGGPDYDPGNVCQDGVVYFCDWVEYGNLSRGFHYVGEDCDEICSSYEQISLGCDGNVCGCKDPDTNEVYTQSQSKTY